MLPWLVASDGAQALRAAIADRERYSCEPMVDRVGGLVVFRLTKV